MEDEEGRVQAVGVATGVVLPNTRLAVDCFKVRGAAAYFLTHFHADHYAGLSKGWKGGPLYCSETTGRLLGHKFPALVEAGLVHVLPLGGPHHLRLPDLRHTGSSPPAEVSVWLTDAGHCPGSVMFLFEGAFGVYFHTGDFRFHRGMLSCPIIKRAQGVVDKLFIDTTFCSPFWSAFPSKEQAIAQVLQIISSQPHNVQVYLECEMLGTQDVLLAVAEKFQTKIFVDEKLRESFKCVPELKRAKIFAADPLESRFHLLKNQRYTNRTEVLLEPDALYIRPSTQWFGQQGNGRGDPARYQTRPCYAHGIWHVLYSIHSSFEELEEFVSFLQPRGLIPLTECSAVALKRLTSSLLNPTGGAAAAPSSVACRLRPPVTTTTTTTTLHRHLSASSLVALAREAEYDDQPPEPRPRVAKKRLLTTALKRTTTTTTTEADFCEDFIMAALDRPNSRKRPLDESPPLRPRSKQHPTRPAPAAPEPTSPARQQIQQLQGSPRKRPTKRALSDPGIRAAAAPAELHQRKAPAAEGEEREAMEAEEKYPLSVSVERHQRKAPETTTNEGTVGEREKRQTTEWKNTPTSATSGGWMSKRRREGPPPSPPPPQPPSSTTATTTEPPGGCREEADFTDESLLQELCALEHHTAEDDQEAEEASECWLISDDEEAW